MKKVLSVLLAAAMVAGMSVSSFAADWTWYGPTAETNVDASELALHNEVQIDKNGDAKVNAADAKLYTEAVADLNPGDVVYIPLYVYDRTVEKVAGTGHTGLPTNLFDYKVNDEIVTDKAGNVNAAGSQTWKVVLDTTTSEYTGKIDEDWTLKSKTDKYIDSVSFVCFNGTKFSSLKADMANTTYPKYIKVALVADIDTTAEVEVDFEVWVKEGSSKSNSASFDGALMANEGTTSVYNEDYINVDSRYTYKAAEKAEVIFDFDEEIFFGVKMIKGEKVILNLSQSYDADIDKAYNEYDADLSFYNFKGTNDSFTKVGELFIAAEEDTFIYEIVDGVITEIEATYVTDHDIYGMDVEDGWVIETNELGYYVVASEELVVPEVEVEEPATDVEAEKANPETGAADFVGAAVAMAVVSVAAAGALALKK